MKFLHNCPDFDGKEISELDTEFIWCWCEFYGCDTELLFIKKRLFLKNERPPKKEIVKKWVKKSLQLEKLRNLKESEVF